MPKSLAPPATNNAVEQQCVAQFLSGDLVLSCSIPHARRLLNKEQNPELVVDQHLSNFTGYTDICFISTRTTGSILPLIRQPDSGDATGSHCGVTRRSSLAFSLAELLSSACGRCSLPVVSLLVASYSRDAESPFHPWHTCSPGLPPCVSRTPW